MSSFIIAACRSAVVPRGGGFAALEPHALAQPVIAHALRQAGLAAGDVDEVISANAIGPGFFPTELTQAVFDDPARAARNAAQTCIGRNGHMEDIDGPILFLCSQASDYVTGQILMVDGGFTAK